MKLFFDFSIRDSYERQAMVSIVRAICSQVNALSEGRTFANYQAQSVMPSGSAVSYATGDIVWDSNPKASRSIAPGVAAQYVRLGWIKTGGGLKEMRVFTGD